MIPSYVRWGFTSFFAIHLVITVLLDIQALPAGDTFPESLKALIKVSYMVVGARTHVFRTGIFLLISIYLGIKQRMKGGGYISYAPVIDVSCQRFHRKPHLSPNSTRGEAH